MTALHESHDRLAVDGDLLGDDIDLEGDVPLVLLPVRVEMRSTADRPRCGCGSIPTRCTPSRSTTGSTRRRARRRHGLLDGGLGGRRRRRPRGRRCVARGRRAGAPLGRRGAAPDEPRATDPAAYPAFPDTPPRRRPSERRAHAARPVLRADRAGRRRPGRPSPAAPSPTSCRSASPSRDELDAARRSTARTCRRIDASLRWLVDYDEAERVGMAVTVPLPVARPGGATGCIVYGVRARSRPADERGAAGAADPRAPLHRRRRVRRPGHADQQHRLGAHRLEPPRPRPVRPRWNPADVLARRQRRRRRGGARHRRRPRSPRCRRRATASRREPRRSTPRCGRRPGATRSSILTPQGRANGDQRLDSPTLDAVRDHWVGHVRGRGPLPVLRLGRQPYGLLPVVDDRRGLAAAGAATSSRTGSCPFIDRQVRWMWTRRRANVPTVMNRPARRGAARDPRHRRGAARAAGAHRAVARPDGESATALTLPDLRRQRRAAADRPGGAGCWPASPMTRSTARPAGRQDPDAGAAAGGRDRPGVRRRTCCEAGPARHAAQERAAGAARPRRRGRAARARQRRPARRLRPPLPRGARQRTGSRPRPGRRAESTRLWASAFDEPAIAEPRPSASTDAGRAARLRAMVADRHPIPALAPPTLVQQLAGPSLDAELLRHRPGCRSIGELLRTAPTGGATLPRRAQDHRRHRSISRSGGCCSPRPSTAARTGSTPGSPRRRRVGWRDLRARTPSGSLPRRLRVAREHRADARPTPPGRSTAASVLHDPGDGGFVHAPGLTHAATAGVLRSGRLTHRRGDPEQRGRSTSTCRAPGCATRCRCSTACGTARRSARCSATGSSAGCTSGPVGALELDRFIYVLRTLAPLRAGKLTDPDQPVEESLAASDVVDGLRLLEMPWAVIAATLARPVRTTSATSPPDPWVPPRPGEAEAVHGRHRRARADPRRGRRPAARRVGAPARQRQPAAGGGRRWTCSAPARPSRRSPRSCAPRGPASPIQHRIAIVVADPPPAAGRRLGRDRPAGPGRAAAGGLGAGRRSATRPGRARRGRRDPARRRRPLRARRALRRRRRRVDDEHAGRADPARPCPAATTSAALWPSPGSSPACCAALLSRRPRRLDVGRPRPSRAPRRCVGRPAGRRRDRRPRGSRRARRWRPRWPARPGASWWRTASRRQPPVGRRLLAPAEQAAAAEALLAEAARRVAEAEPAAGPHQLRPATGRPRRPSSSSPPRRSRRCSAPASSPCPAARPRPPARPTCGPTPSGPAGVTGPTRRRHPALAGAGRHAARPPRRRTARRCWCARRSAPLRCCAWSRRPAALPHLGRAAVPRRACRRSDRSQQSSVAEDHGRRRADLAGAVAGIVVDEWTEVVPRGSSAATRRSRTTPPELVDVTTTGLALNANAPGARPPQAILLAMTPDGGAGPPTGSSTCSTRRSRSRGCACVTLDQIPFAGRYLPALYFRDWSLQGEPVIDWSKLVAAEYSKRPSTLPRREGAVMTFDFITTDRFTEVESFALARPPSWTRLEPQSTIGRPAAGDRGARARPAVADRPAVAARRVRGRGRRHAADRPGRHHDGRPSTAGRPARRRYRCSPWTATSRPARAAGRAEPVARRAGSGAASAGGGRRRRCSRPWTTPGLGAAPRGAVLDNCPLDLDPTHHPDGDDARTSTRRGCGWSACWAAGGRADGRRRARRRALETAAPDLPALAGPSPTTLDRARASLEIRGWRWYRAEVSPAAGRRRRLGRRALRVPLPGRRRRPGARRAGARRRRRRLAQLRRGRRAADCCRPTCHPRPGCSARSTRCWPARCATPACRPTGCGRWRTRRSTSASSRPSRGTSPGCSSPSSR